MFTVTAEPQVAFVDAIRTLLTADATLSAGSTGWRGVTAITGHLSEAARTNYPYLHLGRRHNDHAAGAMQRAGGHVTLEIHGWSDAKGPFEISRVLSRVFRLLERQPLIVAGFDVVGGSLHCELSEVFDEPDEDKPSERLYHGVQRWTAELHEAA